MHNSRPLSRKQRRVRANYLTCRLCLQDFKALRWSHLVRAHGFDPKHPVEDYKSRFQIERTVSGGTARKLKESLAVHFEKQGRRWTARRIKKEILERYRQGRSISWRQMRRDRSDLVWAAGRLLGSWERAVRACGIPYDGVRSHRVWSSDLILNAIRGLHGRGIAVNVGSVRARDGGLLQAALLRWGTWAKALRAAGIDPALARVRRLWTAAAVVKAIRKHGRLVGYRDMKGLDSGLLLAGGKHFGSWRAAVEAAGFPYPTRNPPRKWPRERVLEEIHRRAWTGLSIRNTEIQKECRGLGEAGRREFGSWRCAVLASGLPYPKRVGGWKWPRERILLEIRSRAEKELEVSDRAMKLAAGGLWWAGRREFGTWRAAVEAAGVTYRSGSLSSWAGATSSRPHSGTSAGLVRAVLGKARGRRVTGRH
jgi:hypothetical protein